MKICDRLCTRYIRSDLAGPVQVDGGLLINSCRITIRRDIASFSTLHIATSTSKILLFEREVTMNGSCLCEGVKFQVQGDPENVISCFCSHCSKNAGGPSQYVSISLITYFRMLTGRAFS